MTNSIAYIEGWNSSVNAYTGGNPYWGRAGQEDWQRGRDEAIEKFLGKQESNEDFFARYRANMNLG